MHYFVQGMGRAPKVGQLRSILRFFKPYYRSALISFGLMMLSAGLSLVMPFVTGRTIDAIIAHDLSKVARLVMIAVVASAVAGSTGFLQNYFTAIVTRGFGRDLSLHMFKLLGTARLEFFHDMPPGQIANRIGADVDYVAMVVYNTVFPSVAAFATIVFAIGAMLASNWQLCLLSLITLPLWVISSQPGNAKRFALQQQMMAAMDLHNNIVNERLSLNGILRRKTLLGHIEDTSVYRGVRNNLFEINKRLINVTGINSIAVGVAGSLGPAVTLLFGSWLAARGEITVGLLAAFLALQSRMYQPLMSLFGIRLQMPQLWVRLERISGVIEAPIETDGEFHLNAKQGSLTFERVTIERGQHEILSEASVTVLPGEHIAIIGRSGAGKTTMLHAVLKFCLPRCGSITINGTDLETLNTDSIRDFVTYVPQEIDLLAHSVRANLVYGLNPKPSDQEIWDALTAVSMEERVRRFPQQLSMPVGPNGSVLSGGERQRLLIARALLRPRPIYLFDEATGDIDQLSEREIITELRQRLRGSTIVFVTHRLAAADLFDRILSLSKGKIVSAHSVSALDEGVSEMHARVDAQ